MNRLISLSFVLLATMMQVRSTSTEDIAQKIAAVRAAGTAVGRVSALEDSDFVFDFLHPPSGTSKGAGGHAVGASASNFPGVVGNGVAMTIGFLGPCGLNTPHTHPRATEINYAVNGTLIAGMITENGSRFVSNEVPPGSAVVFPKGSIHFNMNNDCSDMVFVAAFNDEDPGTLSAAQRYFGLPPDFVSVSLGDIGVEQVAGIEAKIPDNIALGIDECRQRCGITNVQQNSTQRQPRVSGNALPSGFSGPPPPATASSTATTSSSSSTYTAAPGGSKAAGSLSSNLDDASSSSSSRTPEELVKEPLVIALITIVVLMTVGYIVIGSLWVVRRRRANADSWNPLAARSDSPFRGHSRTPSGDFALHKEKYDAPMEYPSRS